MNWHEKLLALLLLPKARNHIVLINKELESKPYDELLNNTYNHPIKTISRIYSESLLLGIETIGKRQLFAPLDCAIPTLKSCWI